jgi:hypothetical protein
LRALTVVDAAVASASFAARGAETTALAPKP